MSNSGYPVSKFTWDDRSGAGTDTLVAAPDGGLFVPFSFVLAERGEPGRIYFGAGKELTPVFGVSTFDESSKFFTQATRFAQTAMAGAGVCMMRLVDPAAKKATFGLFAEVTPKQIPQYQRDINGNYILDGSGNPRPALDGSNQPILQNGLHVKFVSRKLTSSEKFDDLEPVTTTVGQSTMTSYPIFAGEMDSVGSYGDRQGYSFSSSRAGNGAIATALGSALYRFAPIELPVGTSTTAQTIADLYGQKGVDVSFKDVAVYNKTGANYAFNFILDENFVVKDTGENTLPYALHVYSDNVESIGLQLIALTPELEGTDPFLIDIVSGEDQSGIPYDNYEIDPTSNLVVGDKIVQYASGGTDGETSFAKLQELMRAWLAGSDHGDFTNLQEWPMTHYVDPGLTMETKYLLFNMLDMRDNIKLDISTQDVMLPPNTKAEDMAAAQALSFRAQMHPEYILNGVGCTRVGIYAHCGKLRSGTAYTGIIPFTYNRLIQRRDLAGSTYLKGSAAGRPNSEVKLFRKPNWTADDNGVRESAWAAAVNTVMHATHNLLFYPSYRTVYPDDTSLLSEDEVSDIIVYMFKIAREVWTIYAGVRKTAEKMFTIIAKDIEDRCANAFSSDNLSVQATVFKTALDENLGYSISVNLAVSGELGLRQANFNVILEREAAAA